MKIPKLEKVKNAICYNAFVGWKFIATGCLKMWRETMTRTNEGHTRPEFIGNYRIIWARSLTTKEVFYLVYYREALDAMSQHQTKTDARAAVKRYQAADARRERDRRHGKAAPLTEHLRSLGVLGPLPT